MSQIFLQHILCPARLGSNYLLLHMRCWLKCHHFIYESFRCTVDQIPSADFRNLPSRVDPDLSAARISIRKRSVTAHLSCTVVAHLLALRARLSV